MIDQGEGKIVRSLLQQPELLKKYCRRHQRLFAEKIIKDPDYIFLYPALKEFYPNAKYLYVIRDPRDTIRSICNRLGLEGTAKKACLPKEEMRGGNHHWEMIISGNLPHIEAVSGNETSFILNLAHRWTLAAEIYMKYENEMILIKYEEFLKEKENVIKIIARQLGVPCVNEISEYVDVQYQSKGNSMVNWGNFFGKDNLTSIENICATPMKKFGYHPSIFSITCKANQ
jgi:hypothetical protein